MKDKIKELDFQLRCCPICNGINFDLLFKGDRHKIGLSNVICNDCGHIYVNPAPTFESLNLFYQKYYRGLYNSDNSPDQNYLSSHHPFEIGTNRNVGDLVFIFNEKNKRNPSKVLDIGCAEGYFLSCFKKILNSNIELHGLEINQEFLNYGVKKGFVSKAFNISFEEFQFLEKYDIITSSHVLEHILEPRMFIEKLISGLNDGGIIFLEFPVGDREYASNYFHIAHLNHFTKSSIKKLSEIYNLNIVLIDKKGTRGGDYGTYRVFISKESFKVENYSLDWRLEEPYDIKAKFLSFRKKLILNVAKTKIKRFLTKLKLLV